MTPQRIWNRLVRNLSKEDKRVHGVKEALASDLHPNICEVTRATHPPRRVFHFIVLDSGKDSRAFIMLMVSS